MKHPIPNRSLPDGDLDSAQVRSSRTRKLQSSASHISKLGGSARESTDLLGSAIHLNDRVAPGRTEPRTLASRRIGHTLNFLASWEGALVVTVAFVFLTLLTLMLAAAGVFGQSRTDRIISLAFGFYIAATALYWLWVFARVLTSD
jgi:hypothetical protein